MSATYFLLIRYLYGTYPLLPATYCYLFTTFSLHMFRQWHILMPILVAYFPVEYINADLRCKGASVLELSEREYNEGPFIAKDGHSGLVTD